MSRFLFSFSFRLVGSLLIPNCPGDTIRVLASTTLDVRCRLLLAQEVRRHLWPGNLQGTDIESQPSVTVAKAITDNGDDATTRVDDGRATMTGLYRIGIDAQLPCPYTRRESSARQADPVGQHPTYGSDHDQATIALHAGRLERCVMLPGQTQP
jgi:hypothetical protein